MKQDGVELVEGARVEFNRETLKDPKTLHLALNTIGPAMVEALLRADDVMPNGAWTVTGVNDGGNLVLERPASQDPETNRPLVDRHPAPRPQTRAERIAARSDRRREARWAERDRRAAEAKPQRGVRRGAP